MHNRTETRATPTRGPSANGVHASAASAAPAGQVEQLLAGLRDLLTRAAAPPETNKLAVNLDEAAAMLSCSAKTVKRMAAAGELPGVIRIRRRVLLSVAALREWIDRGCPPLTESERARKRG